MTGDFRKGRTCWDLARYLIRLAVQFLPLNECNRKNPDGSLHDLYDAFLSLEDVLGVITLLAMQGQLCFSLAKSCIINISVW